MTSYIDASYDVHPNGRSHIGSVITLGKVYAKSTNQKLLSKSSTESELVALSDEASQVLRTRSFLELQGYSMKPTRIYQDVPPEQTRHINVRSFFIRTRLRAANR